MIVKRKIGSQAMRVDCSYDYTRGAGNVLDAFEELALSGTALAAGTEIRFGWTLLRLEDDDTGLLITEPDFVNWPKERWSRNIDISLKVIREQVGLLKTLNVDGKDAFFDQFLIGVPGVLMQTRIFLSRKDGISIEDSGWLIGDVEDPEALTQDAGLERIAVADLVRLRPALLQVLALPPGFIAVFSGDSIEEIYDAGGKPRLQESYL